MSYTCLNPNCDGDLNADLVGGHYEAVCAKCMSPAPLVNVLRERERLLRENERLRSEHEAKVEKLRDLIRQAIVFVDVAESLIEDLDEDDIASSREFVARAHAALETKP